jgi:hypothetical protein
MVGARVVGAGLLAFRDFGTFLRRPQADLGLAGSRWLYGHGVSQTGRLLRHYLYLGLNRDEQGTPAYDGLLVHVAGGRRGEYNHRFAQPSVSTTPGLGGLFPFADDETTDPFSGASDGLLKRQRARGGTPKVVYTNTSAEYWRGDAALAHIHPAGTADLPDGSEARIYHFAGCQHSSGSLPQRDRDANEGNRGRYGFNLVDYTPLVRGALVNLDLWAREGIDPPESNHPRLADGTLVEAAGVLKTFSSLPGMAVPDPEQIGALFEMDLGPGAAQGVGSYPAKLGRRYPRPLPAVDADGNEIAGVRLPDVSVPVGTHTGWNPRHPETGAPQTIIPMQGFSRFFAPTRNERERTGDPRPSIAERYADKGAYLALVRKEALQLAERRYILADDIDAVVDNCAVRYDLAVAAGEPAAVVG